MSIIECKYLDKISILKSTVIKYLLSDTAVSGRVCCAVCLSNIYIISCVYDFIHIWRGDISPATETGQYFLSVSSSLSGRAGRCFNDVATSHYLWVIHHLWVLASVTRISGDNTRPGTGRATNTTHSRRFNYSYQPDFLRVIEKSQILLLTRLTEKLNIIVTLGFVGIVNSRK